MEILTVLVRFGFTSFYIDSIKMDTESSSVGPPPLPPRLNPHSRLLNFEISLCDDSSRSDPVEIKLKNISESITFGELKEKFVVEALSQLTELAKVRELPLDVPSLVGALRFHGMQNPSGLNNSVSEFSVLYLFSSLQADLSSSFFFLGYSQEYVFAS